MTQSTSPTPPSRPTADDIREYLVGRLAQIQRVPIEEIEVDEHFANFDLDSLQFVTFVGELEDWLGCRFTGNPLWANPTIVSFSAYVAQELGRGNTLIQPPPQNDEGAPNTEVR